MKRIKRIDMEEIATVSKKELSYYDENNKKITIDFAECAKNYK